jgi:hypothetical protein
MSEHKPQKCIIYQVFILFFIVIVIQIFSLWFVVFELFCWMSVRMNSNKSERISFDFDWISLKVFYDFFWKCLKTFELVCFLCWGFDVESDTEERIATRSNDCWTRFGLCDFDEQRHCSNASSRVIFSFSFFVHYIVFRFLIHTHSYSLKNRNSLNWFLFMSYLY